MLGNLAEDHEVREAPFEFDKRLKVSLDGIDSPMNSTRLVLVVPESFGRGLFLEFGEFLGQFRDVKDTSGARRGAP
jgi:hypothetical protein